MLFVFFSFFMNDFVDNLRRSDVKVNQILNDIENSLTLFCAGAVVNVSDTVRNRQAHGLANI